MENEDVIREQMEDTRTSLTEKLETLESQVASTVQGATTNVAETVEAVKETVEAVKDTVQQTVTTVKESVEETICAVKETVQDSLFRTCWTHTNTGRPPTLRSQSCASSSRTISTWRRFSPASSVLWSSTDTTYSNPTGLRCLS